MKRPQKTPGMEMATRDYLAVQCDEAAKNIQFFKKWTEANIWLDQTKINFTMPWFPFVCFEFASKPLIIHQLGEEGWTVSLSGEIRKTVQGITVAVSPLS